MIMKNPRRLVSFILFVLFILPAIFSFPPLSLQAKEGVFKSEDYSLSMERLFTVKDVIWGFDFLPDQSIVFTERGGKMKVFSFKGRQVIEVKGVPKVVVKGQGGLLDVRVHPEFAKNSWVYFTFSEATNSDGGKYTTVLARAQLKKSELEYYELKNYQKLFAALPASSNTIHFGSRVEFDRKGHVFISVGDRNERPYVQRLSSHLGKIMRLMEDGSIPADNPFVKSADVLPEIWSYGHRSPQGLFYNTLSKELWMAEMGPMGGDEVNVVFSGRNYGWPVITFGKEYFGLPIGEGTSKAGMEQPVVYYVPSISPSGAAFYLGGASAGFSKWSGNIFLANLSGQHLRRLVLDGHTVVHQEVLLAELGFRFRQVRQSPDDKLCFSTDQGLLACLVQTQLKSAL